VGPVAPVGPTGWWQDQQDEVPADVQRIWTLVIGPSYLRLVYVSVA
jgi:hypothetical protein